MSHFQAHRRLLRVLTVEEYAASAQDTIAVGAQFEFQDLETGERRIGYYDAQTRRLTILSDDESTIVSHFRCNERYVIGRPMSTYQP